MGLDQYLYARKYISGHNYKRSAVGDYSDNITPNPKLDRVIEAIDLTRNDLKVDSPSVIVSVKVIQWRKANQVHEWFVQNIQDGVDNCKPHYVSRESLEELLFDLGQVLEAHNEGNDSMANDLLPTQEGFFFGPTDYEEFYWETTQQTYEAVNALLNNPKFDDFDFEYESSW